MKEVISNILLVPQKGEVYRMYLKDFERHVTLQIDGDDINREAIFATIIQPIELNGKKTTFSINLFNTELCTGSLKKL